MSIGAVAVAQLAIVKVDWLSDFFDATHLSGAQFAICVAAGSAVLWLEEIRKIVVRRRT
jgi:Ca2+-transporting ATPase